MSDITNVKVINPSTLEVTTTLVRERKKDDLERDRERLVQESARVQGKITKLDALLAEFEN